MESYNIAEGNINLRSVSTYADTEYLLPLDILTEKYFQFSRYNLIDDILFDLTLKSNLKVINNKIWRASDIVYGNKYSPDEPGNIILSTIPNIRDQHITADDYCVNFINNVNHETNKPLGLVLSCVNHYELFNGQDIISPSTWNKYGIKHYHLPMTDFEASAKVSQLIHAALVAMKIYCEGKNVLVHCKAGKSRSLSQVVIIIALLQAQYGNKKYHTIDDINHLVNELRKHRPQIEMGDEKTKLVLKAIESYYYGVQENFSNLLVKKSFLAEKFQGAYEEYKTNNSQFFDNTSHNFNNPPLMTFRIALCSLEIKNAIVQTPAFKAMSGYITQFIKSKRASHLKHFLLDFIQATSDDWFAAFIKDQELDETSKVEFFHCPLTDFYYSHPEFRDDDALKRQEIVNLFKENIKSVICEILNLSSVEWVCMIDEYQKDLLLEKKLIIKMRENLFDMNELCLMPSFISLINYKELKACESSLFKSVRAKNLNKFMMDITNSMTTNSIDWMFELLTDSHLNVNKFLAAKPERTINDSGKRQQLIDDFKETIKIKLKAKLNCDMPMLERMVRRQMQLVKRDLPVTKQKIEKKNLIVNL